MRKKKGHELSERDMVIVSNLINLPKDPIERIPLDGDVDWDKISKNDFWFSARYLMDKQLIGDSEQNRILSMRLKKLIIKGKLPYKDSKKESRDRCIYRLDNNENTLVFLFDEFYKNGEIWIFINSKYFTSNIQKIKKLDQKLLKYYDLYLESKIQSKIDKQK